MYSFSAPRLSKLKKQILEICKAPDWMPFDVEEGYFPFTCADIAARIGRPHGNTHRALMAMVKHGLLETVVVERECRCFAQDARITYGNKTLQAYVLPSEKQSVIDVLAEWEATSEERLQKGISNLFSAFSC